MKAFALVALIENSGFGDEHAAPAVRGVYNVYYKNTRHEDPPGTVQQIAKKETPAAPARAAAQTAGAGQQAAVVSNR